jgi:hypothetical protein
MNNEIIQSITYDIYDDFQHVNSLFSQNFISLFWRFNDEIDLKVRYFEIIVPPNNYKLRFLCDFGSKNNTQAEKCEGTKSTRTHDEKLGPNRTQVKH